jgi:hypothetical protein
MAGARGGSLWQDRRLWAAVALAVLVHLAILGYLARYPRGIFAKGDAVDYHVLGENLLHHRTFGFVTKERGILPEVKDGVLVLPPPALGQDHRFSPDPYRTLGYPMFLALIYGWGGGPYAAVVVQSLLSLVTLWLTVLLATRLFQEPAMGWRVALLAAVEPLNFIHSHQLMSDSLFTLLVLGAVLLYLQLLLAPAPPRPLVGAVLAGLLLGGAILTRPVGIYFPVVPLLWLLAYRWGLGQFPASGSRAAMQVTSATGPQTGVAVLRWGPLAVLAAVTIFTVTPWVVRNYVAFHRIFISTSADHNLMINVGAQIETTLRSPQARLSYWQLRQELEKELTAQMAREGLEVDNEAARAAYFRQWSVKIIKAHPFLALRYYFKGVVTQFFSDIPSFFELLGATGERRSGWGSLIQQGLRPALTQYFGPHWPLWVVAALPLIVYDMAVYLLALGGMVALWRSRSWLLLLILASMIGYFLAASAIIGLPRYRLPAMPYYITLAAWGWCRGTKGSRGAIP